MSEGEEAPGRGRARLRGLLSGGRDVDLRRVLNSRRGLRGGVLSPSRGTLHQSPEGSAQRSRSSLRPGCRPSRGRMGIYQYDAQGKFYLHSVDSLLIFSSQVLPSGIPSLPSGTRALPAGPSPTPAVEGPFLGSTTTVLRVPVTPPRMTMVGSLRQLMSSPLTSIWKKHYIINM